MSNNADIKVTMLQVVALVQQAKAILKQAEALAESVDMYFDFDSLDSLSFDVENGQYSDWQSSSC